MSPDDTSLDSLRIDRSEPDEPRRRLWIPAVILVSLAIAAGAWFLSRPGAAEVKVVTVTESVTTSGQRTVLNASGYVTARRRATVSSKVTGKVVEVHVEEGLVVDEGQVLARLDRSNIDVVLRLVKAQLAAARSSIKETEVRIAEARLDLGRVEKLVAESVSSPDELDHARAGLDALIARLDRQKKEIVVARRQLELRLQDEEDTVIRAPFAGVVVSKNAQPGEMISPVSAGGGFTRTGICTLVDMSSLEIEVDVNESYINRVKAGQPAEAVLDAYANWKIPARVIAIIPTADRQKATVQVRIGFEKLDPRILPDMGVKVAFQEDAEKAALTATRRVVTIPRKALHKDGGTDIVFVVSDGRAERRAVNVQNQNDAMVEILSGLRSGERLIVEGPEDLKEGDKVKEVKG